MKFGPEYGRNSLGIAARKELRSIPVRVEYVAPGYMLYCRSVETGRRITIHASDFTPMPQIPSKFREHVFTEMAPYWAKALASWPKAVLVTPESGSYETLTRKLRESRVAKNNYNWRHESIDDKRWSELNQAFVVTLTDSGVRIGPPDAKEVIAFAAAITSQNTILVQWKNQENLEQFCNLVTQRVFDPKPKFVLFGVTPDQADDLQKRYDLGLELREDGKSYEVIF